MILFLALSEYDIASSAVVALHISSSSEHSCLMVGIYDIVRPVCILSHAGRKVRIEFPVRVPPPDGRAMR